MRVPTRRDARHPKQGKVELFKRDQQPLRTYARHYYDLFQLKQTGSFKLS